MIRKKIVAGNWKMNTNIDEAKTLIQEVLSKMPELNNSTKVIVAPPFTHLFSVAELLKDSSIELSAQNCHQELKGAYTGEISPSMLEQMGVQYVILGHSERREYFGENEELLLKKIKAALTQNLSVIYCVGEKLDARQDNLQETIVAQQLSVLSQLSEEEMASVILAYEPVWAIGTGQTATAQQAHDMHTFIRSKVGEYFNQTIADETTILYGGSCNAQNADEIFSMPDVDGGLIGGAALKATDFLAIINARLKN